MTMLETLFGLIPAASRGQQWLAEDLQLVNWGGYDGAHRVRFSPGATLLCGGSGSGKSTLMDAYIALMMPHTTPFNGASNGGVTGRPRGEDQRNILSYARGKLDESRTDEGTAVRVLRGDGTDTWTAVAMTWVDHDGSRFSAVRAWYVPAAPACSRRRCACGRPPRAHSISGRSRRPLPSASRTRRCARRGWIRSRPTASSRRVCTRSSASEPRVPERRRRACSRASRPASRSPLSTISTSDSCSRSRSRSPPPTRWSPTSTSSRAPGCGCSPPGSRWRRWSRSEACGCASPRQPNACG
ncbi:hypothetical protein ACH61_03213 [Rathayibacter tanaceti]|uniref:Uncharacterized protein n=1 Tax=Rathayibacter tanaceti TaxID=1671680 RepID=A0A166H011_9MICO|nr:hypothetical protein ACH61_03213 [Rathayibacter tanaceti]